MRYKKVDGEAVLNEEGKKIFDEEKDMFAVKCGDNYVQSAEVGGLMIYSIHLKFDTMLTKWLFLEKTRM